MANPENEDFAALTAQAVARAQTEERSRISAIHAAEGATVHATLAAAFVAAGTPAADATAWLKLAADSTTAAIAAHKPETDPVAEAAARKAAHLQQKKEEGALGLGTPDTTETQRAASAGWGKAVASVNGGMN